jgi:hypothetical protein
VNRAGSLQPSASSWANRFENPARTTKNGIMIFFITIFLLNNSSSPENLPLIRFPEQ